MTTPLVRPFRALRAGAARASDVIAPPYDVLSSEEARTRSEGKPFSFLHVSKAEIDFPDGTDPHDDAVYAKAQANLKAMEKAGAMVRDSAPGYYVYRVTKGDHVQTGIAAAGSIDAFRANVIRRHEMTRPDKVEDRARQIEAVAAHTGPVFSVHRPNVPLAAAVRATIETPPTVGAVADDGSRHDLWAVSEPTAVRDITEGFRTLGVIYVADGHHRSDAATLVADRRRAANPQHRGDEAYNFFLVVSFPANEVRILDYNRVVRDLAGLSPTQFCEKLRGAFEVEPAMERFRPARRGEFGLFVDGRWHRMTIRDLPAAGGDPIERLDVTLLSRRALEPVLGIGDPRTDTRIDFVGGGRGLEELERLVNSGTMAAAFALYPTTIDDLFAVADAGRNMPPKSTWFEPKLVDGLVALPLD
ncbi:MAG: DUF1015 domain-containing protein [Rhodospirillales bacterium]|nr:DUF1015 domain-containing protein [Rhodospirillales bacterium]